MSKFATGEPNAGNVAVVCFAEDLLRHRPDLAELAKSLLRPRVPDLDDEPVFHLRDLPREDLDKPVEELLKESPDLACYEGLMAMLEEYTYPAVLYRFVRCPIVHTASRSKRTHQLTRGREVKYVHIEGRTMVSISFGPKLMSDWLRAAATGYVSTCVSAGRRPASSVDAGAQQEKLLADRWEKLAPAPKM